MIISSFQPVVNNAISGKDGDQGDKNHITIKHSCRFEVNLHSVICIVNRCKASEHAL